MPTLSGGDDITNLRAGLHIWLGSQVAARFVDRGRTVPIARQKDNYSCGICVMNMMERIMFKCPLFTDAQRHTIRVQFFNTLLEYLLDIVSRPPTRTLTGWQPLIASYQSPAFETRVGEGTETHRAGKAYQALTFDGERTVVNASWVSKRRFNVLSLQTLLDGLS